MRFHKIDGLKTKIRIKSVVIRTNNVTVLLNNRILKNYFVLLFVLFVVGWIVLSCIFLLISFV